MNWFLGFLLVCSIAANVILALVLADCEPKNVDVLTNTFMITGELWNAIRLTAAEAADRIVELERRSQ